jgi:hypothetical protein
MAGNTFVIKNQKYVMGNCKKIFAFRHKIDARIIRDSLHCPEQKIRTLTNKMHYLLKAGEDMNPDIKSVLHIEEIDFESFYYKAKTNRLELYLIDFVIEKKNKIVLIGSKPEDVDDEDDEVDARKYIEEIFKKL